MINGEIVCEDYEIIKKVGEGSFGYVYKVRHRTTGQLYALKTDEKSVTKMQLHNEVQVLKQIQQKLKKSQNKISQHHGMIGYCLDSFFSQESFNKMVMPLFGQNLFNIFHKCNKRFDSSTIYQVAKSMLKNIELVHSLGFIHRDVKPQNFVIGEVFDEKNRHDDGIYLLDFGLAKPFVIDSDLNKKEDHIPYEIGRRIRGTPMYMSINVMLGIEPSRRDDLQSLMYIIVLLMKGRLPWHGLKVTKKDFDDLIVAKMSIHPDQLFANLPKQLKDIFVYIRKLKFQEKPDYDKILQSFESILTCKNQKIEEQYNSKYRKYCWEMLLQRQNSYSSQSYVEKDWFQQLIKQIEYSLIS